MTDRRPKTLRGSCLCGKVEYQVEDSFHYSQNCHCSDCRRATGSAFKPFAGIERAKLRITADEASVLQYGNGPAFDVRCRACGSLLFSVVRNAEWVHVAMGTLVDAPSIKPSGHLFVGDKAPWFQITDNLPQYQGHVT
jgi:hypothetical protein